jgi:hypothetical protein
MITALLALPLAAFAGEKKKLTLADLPAKVADPIRAAAGETPVKIKTEKEDGVEAFEAKWDVKGLAHEITVSTEGVVLGLEEVIPVESAPEPVQATIKTLASVGELIGVEKATVKDIVQYEAAFKTAEGKLEVKIDASGKEVSRETKKKKVKKEKEEHEEKDEDGDGD